MITINDLTKYIDAQELINLTDDENLGSINNARLLQAIESASNEVKSYLQGRYVISSPLNDYLKQIVADITIYHLYKRRMRLDMPDSIVNIYNNAVEKLVKIQNGELLLTGLNAVEQSGFIKTNKHTTDKVFGTNLNGY